MSINLLEGIDPGNAAILAPEAVAFANAAQEVMPDTNEITGWGTRNDDGSIVLDNTFPIIYVGTHTAVGAQPKYHSFTVTWTGHGNANNPGDCVGQTRVPVFVANAIQPAVGIKTIAAGVDAGFDAFAEYLRDSALAWADTYGQKANVRSGYPIQWNGHAQRVLGS